MWAVLEIPGVAPALGALLAILLLYGLYRVRDVFAHFVPDVTILGHNLRSLFVGAATDAIDVVRSLLDRFTRPIVIFFRAVGAFGFLILGGIVSGVVLSAAAIQHTVLHIIPAKLAELRDWARALVARAVHDLVGWVNVIRSNLWDGIHAARHLARALVSAAEARLLQTVNVMRAGVWAGIHAAEDAARQMVAGLAAQVAHELTALRAWTVQRILGVEHDLNLAVRAVEADIARAEAAAVHTVEVDLVRPLEATWDGVAADVSALEATIATDFGDIGALLRSLDLSKLVDLLGVSGLSLVMSRILARYLRECGIPTCRNTAGWAKELQDLLGLIGDAGLLGLFTSMILEPQATAHTVDELLGALARPFVGEIRQLVGV